MIEITLSLLLIATNVFWAFVVVRLTDRLMSRNYVEYAQGKVLGKPQPMSQATTELVEDPIDQQQAQEMNSMMGIA